MILHSGDQRNLPRGWCGDRTGDRACPLLGGRVTFAPLGTVWSKETADAAPQPALDGIFARKGRTSLSEEITDEVDCAVTRGGIRRYPSSITAGKPVSRKK
jgi:hypothetical protein